MTSRLDGITLALCQMKVTPGRPDLNVAYIVEEIEEAKKRNIDIILFPEMSTTGYFIGDLYEDDAFLRDVQYLNRDIREATKSGITAIIGTPVLVPKKWGEDGRERVLNAAVIYSNGKYIGHTVKTLQPNYRIFDDDRHFFSTRKTAQENKERPEKFLKPFTVVLRNGLTLRFGVMLCEDMWHESYPLNPAEVLSKKGAEIIFNLSASPWTWQKNRKRHEIVRKLAKVCRVPLVYVNNTGAQNTGKNIIIFDGCSTIYDKDGRIIFEIPAYQDGTHDVTILENMAALPEATANDTKELYQAMRTSIKEFFASLPLDSRKVIIGLSGGIDSSLSAALYTDALGPENVIGINMPSKFNLDATKSLARALATNLGIVYEVRPIQTIVDAIAVQSEVREGTLGYENIQARTRMEILAARAQELNCVFSANWNKVEAAFGYGTLYGDMAGAIALIGDLVKREVYQLANYMNRVVFNREVIPKECFNIAPTAELGPNQRDPFDYGTLDRRGYHEEMVRAFTEFRKNPEWLLELFIKGSLENELKLQPGTIIKLFPTGRHFLKDLEKHWRMFIHTYFKRIQGPPIPIVSKRAFGTDLRESLVSPHLTTRYFDLKAQLLSREKPRIAIYGGSFNPPCLHHRQIVIALLEWFNHVYIVPCGPREDKDSLAETSLDARKEMTRLNFEDLKNATIDLFDLENGIFTPSYDVNERYKNQYQDNEIWHVVGSDLVSGGGKNASEIQQSWKKGEEVWRTLKFVVLVRPGFNFEKKDLPPSSEIIEGEDFLGSSTLIRDRIRNGENVKPLLLPEVFEYINTAKLYKNT